MTRSVSSYDLQERGRVMALDGFATNYLLYRLLTTVNELRESHGRDELPEEPTWIMMRVEDDEAMVLVDVPDAQYVFLVKTRPEEPEDRLDYECYYSCAFDRLESGVGETLGSCVEYTAELGEAEELTWTLNIGEEVIEIKTQRDDFSFTFYGSR